jgi:hypothetical protein
MSAVMIGVTASAAHAAILATSLEAMVRVMRHSAVTFVTGASALAESVSPAGLSAPASAHAGATASTTGSLALEQRQLSGRVALICPLRNISFGIGQIVNTGLAEICKTAHRQYKQGHARYHPRRFFHFYSPFQVKWSVY